MKSIPFTAVIELRADLNGHKSGYNVDNKTKHEADTAEPELSVPAGNELSNRNNVPPTPLPDFFIRQALYLS